MNDRTKALIEGYIEYIENYDLVPVFKAVKDHILPIYWGVVFNDLIRIFEELGLDTIAPRFECLTNDLAEAREEFADDIEHGYARNEAIFTIFLNRYNVPRYGFSTDDILKYIKAFNLDLNVYMIDNKWRIKI